MAAQPRFSPIELARKLGLPPPTPQQAAIIAAPLEPMLVVAGAGSGKTETMAARVIWLVANGVVEAHSVLGLTFTRKAAGELAGRIRTRLAQLRHHGLCPDEGEPTVATYHSYAAKIVTEHGLRDGIEPSTRLVGEAVAWQWADSAVSHYDGPMNNVDFAPSTVTAKTLMLAGQLAEHLISPRKLIEWLSQWCATIQGLPVGRRSTTPAAVRNILTRQLAKLQLLPLIEQYVARKRSAGAMDFADQLAYAARLASKHPAVGTGERARFRAVLLDEYQDTSHAQLVLLRAIFPDGHPVTAVGDPCQSIYGWRGASAGNLLRFSAEFPTADETPAPVLPLTVSWRNADRVLTVANTLSESLRADPRVTVPPLTSAPIAPAGSVHCALHDTVDDEARWLAEELATRRKAAKQPPSIAVLMRKRDQFDRVAAALRAVGLPVEIVGLGGLLATAEVADVRAMLTVVADPTAGPALLRLLTGPRLQIGPRDIAALAARAKDLGGEPTAPPVGIVEALDDLGPAAQYSAAGYARLRGLAGLLRRLRSRTTQSLVELIAEIERALGLDVEVLVRQASDTVTARAQLDAFADAAAQFSDTADHPTLSAFLAYLVAADEQEYGLAVGRTEPTPDAVQLLTVHAAKGLEWDIVAIPGLTRGVFPPERAESLAWTTQLGAVPFELRGDRADLPELDAHNVSDQAELASEIAAFVDRWKEHERGEERRLAYVAVTRARRELLCSGYWWDQATGIRGPSDFLTEIRDAGAEIAHWAADPLPDTSNPLLATPATAVWPGDPLGHRRPAVLAAAELVQTMARQRNHELMPSTDALEQWRIEARLLLNERARAGRDVIEVELPGQLSVSQLVTLQESPAELARTLRRPMPRPPMPQARRGTAFHRWLETRFGAERLLDTDELPGAGDAEAAPDQQLAALQAAFDASSWASRVPSEVEVGFSYALDDVVVRGRIDAVFPLTIDGEPGAEVVDWKTGKPPSGEAAHAAAVQLAAYRLAWAELSGLPLERVRAAFHYVADNRTIRPTDLLDAAGLRALVAELIPSRNAVIRA